MTEEEYFRKNYPDYCYGERLLSPYWDFFQDGVEFGERQSETKIADIKANCDLAIEGRDIKIKELEKENEELKEKREQDCDSSWYEGFNCSEKERLKQLTKAKELLNEFMRIGKASDEDFEYDYSELIGETEQFLKEGE